MKSRSKIFHGKKSGKGMVYLLKQQGGCEGLVTVVGLVKGSGLPRAN